MLKDSDGFEHLMPNFKTGLNFKLNFDKTIPN